MNASSPAALRVPVHGCRRNKDLSLLLAFALPVCLETHQHTLILNLISWHFQHGAFPADIHRLHRRETSNSSAALSWWPPSSRQLYQKCVAR